MHRKLADKKIAILVADGFEQVELTIPRAALQAAGATVDIVSLRPGKIRGMNLHLPGSMVGVDHTLEEVDEGSYDALFIPGGFINPDLLRQSVRARSFVRAFEFAGKPIASLCHGPWVLASAELARNRTLTSWPGIRDDLVHAGAIWVDQPVVHDRTWVTSRGPQDLNRFVPAMIGLFAGEEVTTEIATTSDPPHTAPPVWALGSMRMITAPRVLLGALAGGVALAAGGMALASLRS